MTILPAGSASFGSTVLSPRVRSPGALKAEEAMPTSKNIYMQEEQKGSCCSANPPQHRMHSTSSETAQGREDGGFFAGDAPQALTLWVTVRSGSCPAACAGCAGAYDARPASAAAAARASRLLVTVVGASLHRCCCS
jgi:hypothetical protein